MTHLIANAHILWHTLNIITNNPNTPININNIKSLLIKSGGKFYTTHDFYGIKSLIEPDFPHPQYQLTFNNYNPDFLINSNDIIIHYAPILWFALWMIYKLHTPSNIVIPSLINNIKSLLNKINLEKEAYTNA